MTDRQVRVGPEPQVDRSGTMGAGGACPDHGVYRGPSCPGCIMDGALVTREPPRGPLPAHVRLAAQFIHPVVWGEPYRPGDGPMHHAGGPYWRSELLRRAEQWELQAQAARVCAEMLPDA